MEVEEIYELFTRNLPFIIREQATVKRIISDADNVFLEKRNEDGELIGCGIINKNTILFLCVEEAYRNNGMGSALLTECEKIIFEKGYDKIILGVGFDYLMPGVPTSKKYADSVHENLNQQLNTKASDFFEKRGYIHSWEKCNCFDMSMSLSKKKEIEENVGDEINGILYRWAEYSDLPEITECVDDACQFQDESFSVYYQTEALYKKNGSQKVLVACKNNKIVGAVIISLGVEKEDTGSVGCTSVRSVETHQGIGKNLIKLGTKYLQSLGLKYGFLGYTYTGLDKMYGESGYEICTYYFMGEKTSQ